MEISIYTDGASRGNPGNSAYAFVFVKPNGEVVERVSGFIGKATNNIAEYTAVIKALEYALNRYPHIEFVLHSDSQVVIKQIRGEYRVSAPHLKGYHDRVNKLIKSLKVSFIHVPRENEFVSLCDRMCSEMLNSVEIMEKGA